MGKHQVDYSRNKLPEKWVLPPKEKEEIIAKNIANGFPWNQEAQMHESGKNDHIIERPGWIFLNEVRIKKASMRKKRH